MYIFKAILAILLACKVSHFGLKSELIPENRQAQVKEGHQARRLRSHGTPHDSARHGAAQVRLFWHAACLRSHGTPHDLYGIRR